MSPGLKYTLVFTVVLILVGAGIVYLSDREIAGSEPAYSLATVERGNLTLSVSATGTLNPLITVEVGSQVSGIIEKVFADYNSEVRKGDVIAQIEPSLFKAEVAQAQANYDSAKAVQEKTAVAVEEAKRQLARARRLHERKMMAESEVDTARFAYDSALVEFRVKQAVVAQAKAALDHALVNLAHTTIYAPIDGVVLSRDVDIGQTVAASLQAPTLFTIAKDLSRMQIETDVDEAFIGMINEGQTVTFTVFAYPRKTFTGKLIQVRLNPRVESDVVLYNSVIHVDNSDLALKPGMTATVTIEVDNRKNVLKVPNAALRYLPEIPSERLKQLRERLSSGRTQALIWTPTDKGPEPVTVNLGLTTDRETEVSAEGLAEGTKVIVADKRKEAVRKRKTGVRLF